MYAFPSAWVDPPRDEHKVRRRIRCYLATGALFALTVLGGTSSRAAPNGLVQIPTADLYAPGQLSVEFELDGHGTLFGEECERYAHTQFGVTPRLSMGIDRDFDGDSDGLLNAKYLARRWAGGRLAVGLQNLCRGQMAQPYFVASLKAAEQTRLHGGAISLSSGPEIMVGADHAWGPITLMTDWVTGDDNAFSWGIAYALYSDVTITCAALFPSHGGRTAHLVNLQWILKSR